MAALAYQRNGNQRIEIISLMNKRKWRNEIMAASAKWRSVMAAYNAMAAKWRKYQQWHGGIEIIKWRSAAYRNNINNISVIMKSGINGNQRQVAWHESVKAIIIYQSISENNGNQLAIMA